MHFKNTVSVCEGGGGLPRVICSWPVSLWYPLTLEMSLARQSFPLSAQVQDRAQRPQRRERGLEGALLVVKSLGVWTTPVHCEDVPESWILILLCTSGFLWLNEKSHLNAPSAILVPAGETCVKSEKFSVTSHCLRWGVSFLCKFLFGETWKYFNSATVDWWAFVEDATEKNKELFKCRTRISYSASL